jgi:hypothetical protein
MSRGSRAIVTMVSCGSGRESGIKTLISKPLLATAAVADQSSAWDSFCR